MLILNILLALGLLFVAYCLIAYTGNDTDSIKYPFRWDGPMRTIIHDGDLRITLQSWLTIDSNQTTGLTNISIITFGPIKCRCGTIRTKWNGFRFSNLMMLNHTEGHLFSFPRTDSIMTEGLTLFLRESYLRRLWHLPPCNFQKVMLALHPFPESLRTNTTFLEICKFLRE